MQVKKTIFKEQIEEREAQKQTLKFYKLKENKDVVSS